MVAFPELLGRNEPPPLEGGNWPKSARLGLRRPEEEEDASLRRIRDVCGVYGLLAEDAMDSLYNVDESAVDTDVLGDPGRFIDCSS